MNSRPSYQLTRFPLGSLREIVALAVPLAVSLISNCLMCFIDRLFLARFSTDAMNASVNALIWYYALTITLFAIAETSEVFVGRANGSGMIKKSGKAVWQLLFIILALSIPMIIFSKIGSSLFFSGYNAQQETDYFVTLMNFAPFCEGCICLTGFFIAIGRPKIIAISVIGANLINVFLDPICIFGFGPIPAMGAKGAALATGVSQVCQFGALLWLFLRPKMRELYGTSLMGLDWTILKDCLRVSIPSGIARSVEIFAHCAFMRIIMGIGTDIMTTFSVLHSIYTLVFFLTEAISKSSSAVSANVFGAKLEHKLPQVILSTLRLTLVVTVILTVLFPLFSGLICDLFLYDFTPVNPAYNFRADVFWALILVGACFFFDAASFIFIGFLTAAKDTRFLIFASPFIYWGLYVPPAMYFLTPETASTTFAWTLITISWAAGTGILGLRALWIIRKSIQQRETENLSIQAAPIPVSDRQPLIA